MKEVCLGLILLLGCGSAYGGECEDLISEVTPQLRQKYDALKVYKKVEDRTGKFQEMKGRVNNREDAVALAKEISLAMQAIQVSSALGKRSSSLSGEESISLLAMPGLVIKDFEDKFSEIVLFCVGKMRIRKGVRGFILYVTKDEEGDRFWDVKAGPIE